MLMSQDDRQLCHTKTFQAVNRTSRRHSFHCEDRSISVVRVNSHYRFKFSLNTRVTPQLHLSDERCSICTSLRVNVCTYTCVGTNTCTRAQKAEKKLGCHSSALLDHSHSFILPVPPFSFPTLHPFMPPSSSFQPSFPGYCFCLLVCLSFALAQSIPDM